MKRTKETIEYVEKFLIGLNHSDARVINWDDNGKIRIHGVEIDNFHPCGINKSYTIKEIKQIT